MCKVQWSHHTKEEDTWEREEELKAEFFQISFPIHPNLGDEIHFNGGRFVTPYFLQRSKTLEIIQLYKYLCLLHSCHHIISFVLICASLFCFVSRSCSMFEFVLFQMNLQSIKDLKFIKNLHTSLLALGQIPTEAQPARPLSPARTAT
jgi:hypothetical protein